MQQRKRHPWWPCALGTTFSLHPPYYRFADASSLGSSVRYSETMNTIAKAALIVVILLFVALLLWGLWLQ